MAPKCAPVGARHETIKVGWNRGTLNFIEAVTPRNLDGAGLAGIDSWLAKPRRRCKPTSKTASPNKSQEPIWWDRVRASKKVRGVLDAGTLKISRATHPRWPGSAQNRADVTPDFIKGPSRLTRGPRQKMTLQECRIPPMLGFPNADRNRILASGQPRGAWHHSVRNQTGASRYEVCPFSKRQTPRVFWRRGQREGSMPANYCIRYPLTSR